MNTLQPELETLVIEAAQNPEKRTKLISEIGQKYLKPLFGRELEEGLFAIFKYLYEHEDIWKSNLMMAPYYRRNKEVNTFPDIWFTIRDYFGWCILYPEEADLYFKMSETGEVKVADNPKIRLLDKDNKKDVYKTELGRQFLTQVKKERDFLIKSGFTLGQKDDILKVCLIGLMILPDGYKKPEAKVKKIVYTAQQKTQAKDLIKQSVKKAKIKLTIKEMTEISLLLLASKEDLNAKSAEKYLKDYMKEKNATN